MSVCTTRYTEIKNAFIHRIINWTVLAGLAAAKPNCTQKKWLHEQAQKKTKQKVSDQTQNP